MLRWLIVFGCALLAGCSDAQSGKPPPVVYSAEEVRQMVARNFSVKPGFVIAHDPVLGGAYAIAWPAPFVVKCQLNSLSVSFGKANGEGDFPVTVHLVMAGTLDDTECPAHVEFIGQYFQAPASAGSAPAVSAQRQ